MNVEHLVNLINSCTFSCTETLDMLQNNVLLFVENHRLQIVLHLLPNVHAGRLLLAIICQTSLKRIKACKIFVGPRTIWNQQEYLSAQ